MFTNLMRRSKINIKAVVRRPLKFFLNFFAKLFLFNKFCRSILFDNHEPNDLLIAHVDETYFILNSSDKVISRSVFVNQRAFDMEKLHEAIEFLDIKLDLLIDVGANIGTVCLSALTNNLCNTAIAIEPDPINFKLLDLNIKLNGLNIRIQVYNYALSDGNCCQMEFELSKTNFGDHRLRFQTMPGNFDESQRETIFVNTKMLDSLVSIGSPNTILFMDTQGSEGLVLKGATNLLNKRIPIVTEFWPYGLNRLSCFHEFIDAINNGIYKNFLVLGGALCPINSMKRIYYL